MLDLSRIVSSAEDKATLHQLVDSLDEGDMLCALVFHQHADTAFESCPAVTVYPRDCNNFTLLGMVFAMAATLQQAAIAECEHD